MLESMMDFLEKRHCVKVVFKKVCFSVMGMLRAISGFIQSIFGFVFDAQVHTRAHTHTHARATHTHTCERTCEHTCEHVHSQHP